MSRVFLFLSTLLLSFSVYGQILKPVKWTWKAEEISKGTYRLVFKAKIDKGWHTYSQFINEGGPVKTAFTFEKNASVELVGKTTEKGGKVFDEHDEVFDMQLKYYEEQMVCEQTVKVQKDTKLKGSFEFMACDDHQCLPPDYVEFDFDLKGGVQDAKMVRDSSHSENNVAPPAYDHTFDSTVMAQIDQQVTKDSLEAQNIAAARFGTPLQPCGAETETEGKGLFAIIMLGFLGGLAALITPCVFPMIPLTVSFFTKRSENKAKGKFDALFYAFSIVFIYFLLAVPFLVFDISSDTIYEVSSGIPLNLFFFFVFVVFGISFFGYFEIQLPSFIANKADSASNVGGLLGIFFMALTLAIVSFSCTGPIVGSLLVGALSSASGKLNLVAGMSAFGLALALPFGVFAFFPNLMKVLPKSGGWLNTAKVVLGFAEIIFAFKFLSNADLVGHWGLLKREVFLVVWTLLGVAVVLYLLGKIKFPHHEPVTSFSPLRIGTIMLASIFTVYSAYGIPGNDLHLFSGFPPPKSYSWLETPAAIEPIKNNYEQALARAKAENKPLMIDFTGWTCVNCRKMEENVWPHPEVKKRLAEKFVIVSLYADEREMLPAEQQYMSKVLNKKIRTVGDKFNEMQAIYFNKNAQPYYVLVTPDERLLNNPRPYTPNPDEYVEWLDCGLNAYYQLGMN